METKAFILIETAVGKSRDVARQLSDLQPIRSVDSVTGPYDIIAIASASDLNEVGNLVSTQIHNIDGIVRTVTCLSVSNG